MTKDLTQKTTSLETASRENMIDLFNWKIESVGSYGFADYIGFTIDNLGDKQARAKAVIKDLQALVKQCDGQKMIILSEVASLLANSGTDKLEGDIISSLTLTDPAPKKKLVVHKKEELIELGYSKVSIDETAVKKAIEAGTIQSDFAELQITHEETRAKINKRKSI